MDNEVLLGLYPGYTSVLGPYSRPDGRKHIVLNNSNAAKGTKGKTKTISYPKALVEISLKARLKDNDTVDHHDRDFTNDDLDNLKVKVRSLHAAEDTVRVEACEVNCCGCGKEFIPTTDQINQTDKNVAGPFCSRSCSGRYGALIQNGEPKATRDEITKHYYQNDK